MTNLIDKAKHMVFEDDEKVPTAKPVTHPAPTVSTPAPPPNYGFAASPVFGQPTSPAPLSTLMGGGEGAGNSDLYDRLHSKTDFDQTQAGVILQKYMAPLANLPLDPAMKMKTAVAQASAQDGLTSDKILATFDGLKIALQNESEAFNQTVQSQVDHEVTSRQNRINEITRQLAELQTELQNSSAAMVVAQAKVATAQQQFSFAVSRRSSELDQQKASFANLLKG